jgi:hypothetical protein
MDIKRWKWIHTMEKHGQKDMDSISDTERYTLKIKWRSMDKHNGQFPG